MTETVRERCLKALVEVFRKQTEGQPAADPFPFAWSMVTRSPLPEDITARKRFAIGVYDTTEERTDQMQVTYRVLRVVLEFRVYVERDEERSTVAGQVLGVIQRQIELNSNLDGKAIDLAEVGNEINIETAWQHVIQGVVFVAMTYRHSRSDPRKAA